MYSIDTVCSKSLRAVRGLDVAERMIGNVAGRSIADPCDKVIHADHDFILEDPCPRCVT